MHKRGVIHSRSHGPAANGSRIWRFTRGLIYGLVCALVVVGVLSFINTHYGKPLPAPPLSPDFQSAVSNQKTQFANAGLASDFDINNNFCLRQSARKVLATYNRCMADSIDSLKANPAASAQPQAQIMLVSAQSLSQIEDGCKASSLLKEPMFQPADIVNCMRTEIKSDCNSQNIESNRQACIDNGNVKILNTVSFKMLQMENSAPATTQPQAPVAYITAAQQACLSGLASTASEAQKAGCMALGTGAATPTAPAKTPSATLGMPTDSQRDCLSNLVTLKIKEPGLTALKAECMKPATGTTAQKEILPELSPEQQTLAKYNENFKPYQIWRFRFIQDARYANDWGALLTNYKQDLQSNVIREAYGVCRFYSSPVNGVNHISGECVLEPINLIPSNSLSGYYSLVHLRVTEDKQWFGLADPKVDVMVNDCERVSIKDKKSALNILLQSRSNGQKCWGSGQSDGKMLSGTIKEAGEDIKVKLGVEIPGTMTGEILLRPKFNNGAVGKTASMQFIGERVSSSKDEKKVSNIDTWNNFYAQYVLRLSSVEAANARPSAATTQAAAPSTPSKTIDYSKYLPTFGTSKPDLTKNIQ